LPTAQNLRSASRGGKKIKSQSQSEAAYRPTWSQLNAFPCRSEPAREKRRDTAGIQTARVIVDVHRQQAGSYKGNADVFG